MIKSINKFSARYRQNEDGATGVEFALVAIPFLLMIFGIMEAGRLVWAMNGVQYAVEETSRYASLNVSEGNDAFQTYAENKLEEMFISSSPLEIISNTVTSNGIDFVQIDGDYTHTTMLSGFLPADFGNFEFETSVRKPVIQ